MNQNLENKLKEFKAAMMLQLDDIKTFDQVEAVRNICAPIRPTLDAMKNSINFAQSSSTGFNNAPHNKKIIPQRRLYSTKKTSKKGKHYPNQAAKKPTLLQFN